MIDRAAEISLVIFTWLALCSTASAQTLVLPPPPAFLGNAAPFGPPGPIDPAFLGGAETATSGGGALNPTQPATTSGSFSVPGLGMIFRLQHTAGEQYGLFPSYTAFGGSYLVPLARGVWLVDGQIYLDNYGRVGGSFDSIWRIARNETVWGFGLGGDLTPSDQNTWSQGVVSLEMLRPNWGVRANGYFPFDETEDYKNVSWTTIELQDTFVQRVNYNQLFRETPMSGADIEVYRSFANSRAEVFAGSYVFDSDRDPTSGYKLGARGLVTQQISASLQLTNDAVFDTRVFGNLTWFFGPGKGAREQSDRRMVTPVRRNHYVAIDQQVSESSTRDNITDQSTGAPLHVFFGTEGGAGTGTQGNPGGIGSILSDPRFGPGSVLLLVDTNGPITSNIQLTADRQQVIGAMSGSALIDMTLASNQADAILPLFDLGGTPTLSPSSGDAITLSSSGLGHTIRGVILDGSNGALNGIVDFDAMALGSSATDTLIQDVALRNFSGTGIIIRPSINTQLDNILFENNAQDLYLNALNTSLSNITIRGAQGDGLVLANTTGKTLLENISIENSAGAGLKLTNPGGELEFRNLDIADSGGAGIEIEGGDGSLIFDANSTVMNSGDAALKVNGGSSQVMFDGSILQTGQGALVSAGGAHTGELILRNGTLQATQGSGIEFNEAHGNYQFDAALSLTGGGVRYQQSSGSVSFQDLTINDPTEAGVLLEDSSGNFSVTGALAINGAEGDAAIKASNAQSGSTTSFGSTTIRATGSGTAGVELSNNASDALFDFNDLRISTIDGSGFKADEGGVVNFSGTAPEIEAMGGPAVDLEATRGQFNGAEGWVFSELQSTDSVAQGVRLSNLNDNFQVVGSTSITNAATTGFESHASGKDISLTSLSVDGADTGLEVTDHSGSFTVSGVELLAGSGGQIRNVRVGANFVNVGEATLRNVDIEAESRAVIGTVANAQDSTLSLQNSTLRGGGETGVYFNTSAGSTGRLIASLWNNQVHGQAAAVRAFAAGGDVDLTASENHFYGASSTGIMSENANGAVVNLTEFQNVVHDSSQGWQRDTNPLLVAGAIGSDGKRETVIADPDVLYDSSTGVWHLYYFSGRATTYGDDSDLELYIQHATSSDGTGWILDPGRALDLPGDPLAWDAIRVETPSVVLDPSAPDDRRYKLFYSGASEFGPLGFPDYQIGLAFSADGSSFSRVSAAESPYGQAGAVLKVGDVLGDIPGMVDGVLADPEVKLVDGVYNMWFSSFAADVDNNPLAFGISHATSIDGINWNPNATSPIPSLLWPGGDFGGQQPSIVRNDALDRWEAYFTSDTEADKARMPSTFNPSTGVWRATSNDRSNWNLDLSGRDFNWDPNSLHEQVGLLTGLEVVIVDNVRHIYYTGWSPVNPPPNFVVPTATGFEPAVLTLLHATKSAFED